LFYDEKCCEEVTGGQTFISIVKKGGKGDRLLFLCGVPEKRLFPLSRKRCLSPFSKDLKI